MEKYIQTRRFYRLQYQQKVTKHVHVRFVTCYLYKKYNYNEHKEFKEIVKI